VHQADEDERDILEMRELRVSINPGKQGRMSVCTRQMKARTSRPLCSSLKIIASGTHQFNKTHLESMTPFMSVVGSKQTARRVYGGGKVLRHAEGTKPDERVLQFFNF
jgi:hypothetical protein